MTTAQQRGVLVHKSSIAFAAAADDPLGHCCEPRMALLSDGSILLAHRVGSGRMSADGTIQFLTSRDGGQTWRILGRPFPAVFEGRRGDYQLATLLALSGGRVIVAAAWIDRNEPNEPWRNVETEGRRPMKMLMSHSQDFGQSWAPLESVSVLPHKQPLAQGLCRLPSGELLATYETLKEFDDSAPWHYESGVIRSSDEGHTWSVPIEAATVDSSGNMWWDPRITTLTDGTVVQFYHAINYPSGRDLDVHVGWSADGKTWSTPTPTGIAGQMSWPASLPDGRLALATQFRHDPKGVGLFISPDSGHTFDHTVNWVYRHEGMSRGAADGSVSTSDYFLDMDAFTFGHPCCVATGRASLLVSYYAGARGRTSVYVARVDLAP